MNNKKTIILTFSLATILILGILVFSNGVQTIWQASSEVENNIDVSNTDNVLLIDDYTTNYPYANHSDIPDNTLLSQDSDPFVISLAFEGDDNMISLQEVSNNMIDYLNASYPSVKINNNMSYIDYLKKYETSQDTYILYSAEIVINDNLIIPFHAEIDSLTGEIIKTYTRLEENFKTETSIIATSATDETYYNKALSTDEISKLENQIVDILQSMGYNQAFSNSDFSYDIHTVWGSDGENELIDFYAVYYSINITLTDGSEFLFYFTADTDTPILKYMTNFNIALKYE